VSLCCEGERLAAAFSQERGGRRIFSAGRPGARAAPGRPHIMIMAPLLFHRR
jgi:hypothetical protein